MRNLPRIKMVYFAQAREAAGRRGEEFELPGMTTASGAVSRAMEAHPSLRALEGTFRIAVNEEVVLEDPQLREGDRVAILPPVVGG